MSLMFLDKAVTAFHSHNVDATCFAPWCCLLWIILFCKCYQHIFPRLLNYLVGRVYLFILPRVRKLWIILLIDIHPHKWTHQFHISRNKELQHVWQQWRLQQGTAVISMLMCFPKVVVKMMMVHHQPRWPSFSDNLLGTDFTSTLLLLTVFSLSLIVNKTTVLIIICSLHPACA